MAGSFARIRQLLESIRLPIPGSEDGFFYVYERLRAVITEDLVVDSISQSIPDYMREDILARIMADGIRLFSILILMNQLDQIKNFFAHSTLDSRLPITQEAEFRRITPDLDGLFFTKYQWEFFPWVFQKDSGHLIFHSNTVLPFTSEEEIGSGNGGIISAAEIPLEQQEFFTSEDDREVRVARKRIKPARTPEATDGMFTDERECLELYRRLRHPNIIPLLGSFTLNGEHSLLFPLYSMNVGKFLDKDRFGRFNSDITFTAAVADLGSALQSVHEANWRSKTSPTFLARYGYHHDFRPENIFVTESTFVLADFGLAYPRPATKQPVSLWAGGIGHYIAPECMDPEFEHGKVGRFYDIWAFGCFLSDIATYMELGPSGLDKFRTLRETDTFYEEQYGNGYFFHGPSSSLKPQVDTWLRDLSGWSRDSVASLIVLSRRMLKWRDIDRLDMVAHSICLSFIHAKGLFWSAVGSIESTLSALDETPFGVSMNTTEELKLELSKLRAFGDILRMEEPGRVDCELFKNTSFANHVKDCLSRIAAGRGTSRTDSARYAPVWTTSASQPGLVKEVKVLGFPDESIRSDIRKLTEALPEKKYFWHLFTHRHFQGLTDEKTLRMMEESGKEKPELYGELGVHAKLHRLDQALKQGVSSAEVDETSLILEWSDLSPDLMIFDRYRHRGIYNLHGLENTRDALPVFVEWIFISQFPEGEGEGTRIEKLLALARLLHCPKPAGFRTLDCLGFLPPKEDARGYGFVYPFPQGNNSISSMVPISLRKLLGDDKIVITLGEKFEIAKALCNSVFQLHSRNWLHKNVRPDNIIFFMDEAERMKARKLAISATIGPYVIGFYHGRPDRDFFLSDLTSGEENTETLLHQHPGYKPGENRFQKAYDYYGLGVILLELAFWRPAEELRKRKSTSLVGEPLQGMFLKTYVTKLAEVMGKSYMEATKFCLGGTADSNKAVLASDDISEFYTSVVSKLDACYVG